jgi:hypothetical protein
MTESEFVNVTNLTRVRMLQRILDQLLPCHAGPITPEMTRAVGNALDAWEQILNELVAVDEQDEEPEPDAKPAPSEEV